MLGRRKKRNKLPGRLLVVAVLVICLVVICVRYSNMKKEKELAVTTAINSANELSQGYFYEEALQVLADSGYEAEEKILAVQQEIETQQATLTEYDGEFYHVFFHSLVVYPELAFDGDYKAEGYDMWMTTVSEFQAMLPQLYERDFILYPMNLIQKDQPVMLPAGKKPLIISIDDVNYYDYMEGDGFAERLVVDENGEIVCEVVTPEGKAELSYNGDVMPILDQFVKEHPDFSFRGAKGVVAVTGYEGAFGYNFIKAEGEEKQKLMDEATKVATALKNTGWLIACHSYTHNDYFKDGTVSNENLHYDTNRFKERIYEVVLQPDIYISPFGYHLHEGDERLMYLKNMGYDYFCPVSTAMRTLYTKEGVVISERFNLDRYNMRNQKKFINETFFDVDSVYYKN
ncbi:hypothetical protein [Treponema sp.]|uniref:hypothetical protein n=1 Tax=Treponema sp. TaxID=166 RepID=UPI00388DF491